MAETDPRIGRLRWRSRRGMKELDVLLEPFFESDLSTCDEMTITALERLLDCEDTELLDWLLGRSVPGDVQFQSLVKRLRQG